MGWWLYALDCIEKNKDDTDELFKKIDSLSTKSTTGLGTGAISSSRSALKLVQFFFLNLMLVYF